MVRVILALVLTVETLLGPGFCCCSLTHVSWFTSPARADEAKAEKSPCCCCTHATKTESKPADQPTQDRHGCPCREEHAPKTDWVAPALEVSQAKASSADFVHLLVASLDPGLPLLFELSLPFQEPPRPPFLSGRDLLTAHQHLSC